MPCRLHLLFLLLIIPSLLVLVLFLLRQFSTRYFQKLLAETQLYIVSKGRMIVKKRDSTLDFTTKVIIVVCTLVKVYNMKKKTELIVTVVSITSLYF